MSIKDHSEANRRSGRTTRMIEDAKFYADAGHAVYIVSRDWIHLQRRIDNEVHGGAIKCEPDVPRMFEWRLMRPLGSHPNCVWLIDHYWFESNFEFTAMYNQMTRFDKRNNSMCPPESKNKGRGERSGRWEFDSFEFLPGVYGSAAVEYEAIVKRIRTEDREAASLFSAPYEMEIYGEEVKNLIMFNDDGDEIELDENSARAAQEMILLAWRNQNSEVVSFEMGLL